MNRNAARNEIWFYTFTKRNSNLFIFSLSSRKLHKNYQKSGNINSNIYLISSVYNSYHQTVNFARQRNHILQDSGLEIQISMKVSKNENWFETGFQQPKSDLQKKPSINIPKCCITRQSNLIN